MYRVLLIDDEKFIRKSIKNRIDWAKYGFCVEAEAGNGEEALKILEELRPELIIVDIRMPVMDGIAFIAEAKKKLPESCYVIMSAYNDFAYAKRAIQLGVEDYILKPVEEEEMEQILKAAMHRLDQKNIAKQVRRTEDAGEAALRDQYVLAIAFWNDQEEGYGHKIEQCMKQNAHVLENGLTVYPIEGYSREECFLYLLNGEYISEEGIRNLLDEIIMQEGEWVKVAYSGIYDRNCAREAVQQSIQLLKRKIFYSVKRIIQCDRFLNGNEKTEMYREMREQILSAQKSFLKKEYQKSIQEFMVIVDKTIRQEHSIPLIEDMIHESLMMLRYFTDSQQTGAEFNIMFNSFQSKDYLLLYRTADELREKLKEMFGKFMETYGNEENKDIVEAIKSYVRENYAENISTADIACEFHISTSYLSTLFREKTGVKLTNYIEGIRMEKAKEYLKGNMWTITEIAIETGYSDPNYFSKVFKRYVGVGPKQFREIEKGEG